MTSAFIRALEASDKGAAVAAGAHGVIEETARFDVDLATFALVPGSPFAYWVPPSVLRLFSRLTALDDPDRGRMARRGVGTNNDFRFLRVWLEVPSCDSRWVPHAKGGAHGSFYADLELALNWGPSGAELKAHFLATGESPSRNIRSEAEYFRPGITWPLRSQRGLSMRAMPKSCIFGSKGPAIFVSGDAEPELLVLLAITNAAAFTALVELQMAFGSYEVGVLQRTPFPSISNGGAEALARLAHRAWLYKRRLDGGNEASHAFSVPLAIRNSSASLSERASESAETLHATGAALSAIEAEIDDLCFNLYGISETDRRAITEGFGGAEITDSDAGFEDEHDESADPARLATDLLSWCVGVAFGRFDIRLATGEREPPPGPDPFDPLPVCSPGMLTGEDGLPVAAPPDGYPIAWPLDGILVDDPGHPRDLTAAVREVFEVVFGSDADVFWTEAAELVDAKGQDIRRWLSKTFFSEHIKRYSKSRRKAPIYWQLATLSASYSVWLYAHRIGRDSLYQVLNDFVSPKLQAEERKLHALRDEAGPNPSSSQRKERAAQESFVSELRVLRDEVARVAPLWNPDLNDGIVIVTAPLFRLVPQLKSWQKELKSQWVALCAGKYDWAQLAMHLWPERVVPKCAEDRSLAIAHDLEDVFWKQDAVGRWTAREEPARPIDELVAERTSPAVKNALQSLLSAPQPPGGKRSGKVPA